MAAANKFNFENSEPPIRQKLRQCFIENHKKKYPEERLICLAETFCNIEFLGCRYSKELTGLVEGLAKEVDDIVAYRAANERKKLEKRTKKLNKMEITNSPLKPEGAESFSANADDSGAALEGMPCNMDILFRAKRQSGWKGKVVLYRDLSKNVSKMQLCYQSINAAGYTLRIYPLENTESHGVYINDEMFMLYPFSQNKTPADSLGEDLFTTLQKYCFTITVTGEDSSRTRVIELQSLISDQAESSVSLPMSNTGAKMMRLMGWKGKGLGKYSTGIQEPINMKSYGHRFTLGSVDAQFETAVRTRLQKFIEMPEEYKLIFSIQLTKEQRAIAHKVAQSLNLKSRSSGAEDNRQLTISKKVDYWQLVEQLLLAGGSTATHTITLPTHV